MIHYFWAHPQEDVFHRCAGLAGSGDDKQADNGVLPLGLVGKATGSIQFGWGQVTSAWAGIG